jgi:hypothetical protein
MCKDDNARDAVEESIHGPTVVCGLGGAYGSAIGASCSVMSAGIECVCCSLMALGLSGAVGHGAGAAIHTPR